jgi:hypothetical protein
LDFGFQLRFRERVKTTVWFADRPAPLAEIWMFPIAKLPAATKEAVSPHPDDRVKSADDTEDEFPKFSVGTRLINRKNVGGVDPVGSFTWKTLTNIPVALSSKTR